MNTIPKKNYHVKLFVFTIVLWGIWNVRMRNKMGIENFRNGVSS